MKITLPGITPGKWQVNRDYIRGPSEDEWDSGVMLAMIQETTKTGEFEANRQAILSVPDMLAALAAVEEKLARIREITWRTESSGSGGLSDAERCEILDIAREAGWDARDALKEAGATIIYTP